MENGKCKWKTVLTTTQHIILIQLHIDNIPQQIATNTQIYTNTHTHNLFILKIYENVNKL